MHPGVISEMDGGLVEQRFVSDAGAAHGIFHMT